MCVETGVMSPCEAKYLIPCLAIEPRTFKSLTTLFTVIQFDFAIDFVNPPNAALSKKHLFAAFSAILPLLHFFLFALPLPSPPPVFGFFAKTKEDTAKAQGKTGKATATTHGEKEMAKEETRANKAQAKAEMHQEKAEHRAEAAAGRHGTTRVPLTGPHGHHRPAGAAPAAADPAYPGTGAYPATDKYV